MTKILRTIYSILIVFLLHYPLYGQPGDPGDDPDIPIDGASAALLIAGGLFGAKKVYDMSKKKK